MDLSVMTGGIYQRQWMQMKTSDQTGCWMLERNKIEKGYRDIFK